jgi:uncharacterized damage-inducible protein DinB
MNSTLRQHLATTFFAEYQGLRDELLDLLTDEDLDYRVGATAPSLGALCREIGDVERAYVDSFRTFRLEFGDRNPDPQVERRVALLASWYADLDRELTEALEQISQEEIDRRIVRSDFDIDDFAPLPTVQLDIYREALLIFYGKASVYLRSMGKTLPARWEQWIG